MSDIVESDFVTDLRKRNRKLKSDRSKKELKENKNSRQSRSCYGRGLPKKGGAGGKGVWGRPGWAELLNDAIEIDVDDPNYDDPREESDVMPEDIIDALNTSLDDYEFEDGFSMLTHDEGSHQSDELVDDPRPCCIS
ncbi:unnamed protein product [Notodromas monacha]|uniref:Uncharacterized protein n=1 Tax=Notodromas monacha TaxID=399045 RepID=A0A7R9BXA0_9CRUS|nr:unnamed protein product [Notodromas monacha]CAG0923492.1 unnamed protein product [Notodromas monacha]